MSYRPEGWKNIYTISYESCKVTSPEFAIQAGMQGLAYEAGADAMLEALKKEAIHIKTKRGWKYLRDSYEDWLYGNRVGYLAFIEEEK